MPHFPFPVLVLDAHAAVAALHVHSVTTAVIRCAVVRAVDAGAVNPSCAADENNIARARGRGSRKMRWERSRRGGEAVHGSFNEGRKDAVAEATLLQRLESSERLWN